MQRKEFSYIGKNISILLRLNDDTLDLKVFRINTNHHTGDIFCSSISFMDYEDKQFGHLELPIDIVKYRPYATQYENVTEEAFQKICNAVFYYDLHGEKFVYQ